MSDPAVTPPNGARQVIDGRWAVVGAPVKGGMASVIECFDLDGQHGQVALKLLPGTDSDPWRRAGYEREQQALARLSHPNIVRLLHTGRDPDTDQRYLVFPWYPARLQEHLKSAGALSWSAWWEEFGHPILTALELIHRNGVIHRDLKPANILLDEDNTPIIIDFGIAKLESQLAPERTVRGESRPFTPPEADTPASYMATRDVYGWAAVTAFAVSGVDPYPGDDTPADQRLADAVQRARERLPTKVAALIPPCLADDPRVRPPAAGVLLADIEAALTSEARARQTQKAGYASVVHLHLTRNARENLETERDIYSADTADLVERDLEGEHAILPYRGEPDHYLIVGTELSLHVAVAENAQQLVIVNAVTLPDSTLERDRLRGWPGPIRFTTAPAQDPGAATEAISHLRREVAVHDNERSAEERRQRRARPLAVWRTLLSLLRSLESAREDPLAYVVARPTRHGVVFDMARTVTGQLAGQQRLAPLYGGGDYVGLVANAAGTQLALRTVSGDRHEVLPEGSLRYDTRAGTVNIERQQRALDAVEYGRALRPDLGPLLTDPASVRAPRPLQGVRFTPGLDEPKQRAVEAALGSEDILLVHGPPGTGKTRFIRELVTQTLNRDPDCRILVCSQAHVALDNALCEIRAADPTIRTLRVARVDDERVDPKVGEVLLDRNIEEWRREAIQQGNAWLRHWAKTKGIVASEVEGAMRLGELAAHLDRAGELSGPLLDGETHLETLRAAARRASPSATASTALREQAAEVEDLREQLAASEAAARDEIARLTEIGHLPRDARPRNLDAAELRDQAAALLPADRTAARECKQRIGLLNTWHARFGADPAFKAAALLRSQVIGATCVGLGGIRGAENVPFDLCIVDEASRATATEVLIPLACSRRIVLVGDDRQLPPYIDEAVGRPDILRQHNLTEAEIKRSLFEQLARQLPSDNTIELTHQHRMNPAIGRLVSECFYSGRLTSEPRDPLTMLQMLAPCPVTWLTTTHLKNERFERRDGSSVVNDVEARVIRTFLNTANGLAVAARRVLTVAVITGYAAQRDLLERRLEGDLAAWRSLAIEIQTIDSYQGRQADVVLYSMTRSNRRRELGFLRERPRLNVALSRARELLVIVGDHAFAREAGKGQAWREVLDHIEASPGDCCIERARVQ